MKRLRPVIVAVLLFAVWSIPTSSFALSSNLEFSITYLEGADAIGAEVYNSCFGHFDYSWGQQGGNLKREMWAECDTGFATCAWYTWSGSEWVLRGGSGCEPPGDRDRPDRPDY